MGFGVSVLAVLAATVLLGLMEARWHISTPVPLFTVAVIISAWLGGTRPGVLAIALSLASFAYFYLPQAPAPLQAVRLTTFLAVTSFVVWLMARQRRATESLRQVVDAIPVMAWSIRPDGKVDFLNRRWLEYVGLSMEDGLADPTVSIHPDDRGGAMERWQRHMLAGENYAEEMRVRRADGEYRWFLVRTVALRDEIGKILGWYGTSTDIEDRKRAERELRDVIETIPAIAWTARADGANDFTNRSWHEYTGLAVDETAGTGWQTVVHPDDLEKHAGKWLTATLTGEPFENEARYRRAADGEFRWFLVRAVALRDDQGRILRWYGVHADIEDRKRVEQALRDTANRLQQLSRRLLAIQEEERRHLSRELHDEFGQVLAAIALHLQAAKNVAGETAQSSLDQTMTLLQFAGTQVRNLALELRPTMLETAGLDATLRWLAEQYQQRTNILTQVAGHAGDVNGDTAIAGFRVVQEALTNVLRHAQARHVWIELGRASDSLDLEIRDDGIGFDTAATFERAARDGHLGLLGMKERVEILGGSLGVDSRPGDGTRIRVSLPVA